MCELIIDRGSLTNVASITLNDKLPITPQIQLKWIEMTTYVIKDAPSFQVAHS